MSISFGQAIVPASGSTKTLANSAGSRTADGGRIAFRAWNPDPLAFSIYVMRADGSGLVPIVTSESTFAPTWSPTGSRILTRTVRCLTWTEPSPTSGQVCADWDGPYLTTVADDGSDPLRLSDYVLHGDEVTTSRHEAAAGSLEATRPLIVPSTLAS
jgi:hypothetical protein